MDHRSPEPLEPGDFVRHLFSDRLMRVRTCEMAMDTVPIATVTDSRRRFRWYPIASLRRVTPTAAEEAQWLIDQLQH